MAHRRSNLHPDRLFPADPADARPRARALRDGRRTCRSSARTATPIRSGSPTTRRSPNASALFITPDHYVFRMLYSQGVRSRTSASRAATAAPVEHRRAQDLAHVRRALSPVPRHADADLARPRVRDGVRHRRAARPPNRPTAIFDRINECLARPEFRPRALFERFNIEVIATTESPLDPLDASPEDPRVGLEGPRRHRLPARPGRRSGVRGLPRQRRAVRRARPARTRRRGSGYLAAHRKRRAFFKTMGATSTDHGHPTARTCDLAGGRMPAAARPRAGRHGDRRTRPKRSAARC